MRTKTPHWSTLCEIVEHEGWLYLQWKDSKKRIQESKCSTRTKVVCWAISHEKELFEQALESIIFEE